MNTFDMRGQEVNGTQTNVSGVKHVSQSWQMPPVSSKDKVIGDLIWLAVNDEFDVIVHGCNTFHMMGSGIALQIATKFPPALRADMLTLRGDKNKLGTFTSARMPSVGGSYFTVVNAYTQYHYFGPRPRVNYEAIDKAFRAIAIAYDGARIAYPLIGCGLAGGDWNVVEPIINEALKGQTHTLVVYSQEEWDKWF